MQLQLASVISPGAGAMGRAGGEEGRSALVLDAACLHPILLYVSLSPVSADHPALSPIFAILNGGSKRQIILVDLASPRGKSAENTRHKSSPDGV